MASIYMRSEGQGEHIVFIPGLGGLGSFWTPVMDALKGSFQVSACDHPGMGASKATGRPSIYEIASAIIEWMDARAIPHIHVVGHSTGSLVAQALALDFKQRVKSVVLSSGWARTDQRFRDLFELRKQILLKQGGVAYAALGQLIAYPPDWYGKNLATVGGIDFNASSTLDVALTCARIDMLLGYSRADELEGLDIRTLVVGAKDDYVIPFHHSEELARLIPSACLYALNGGHFAPLTRTADYVALLSYFWTSDK